ncbi:MAG: hypothetical protein KGI37_07415 [Alphaproteobacteria bacterium]|nr:hypothetical protein [Alphaproteobacteria bacterium]
MKNAARRIKFLTAVLMALLAVLSMGMTAAARAADLPLAAASPLTGVAFDDKPLLLPVQRNFQMAMLTASSELGRTCGRMEAYGWRMGAAEQGRVNQIFNNTVDRLRLLGYAIAPHKLSSVAGDITLFTADRADKHFIFLWSAGDLGLVMTLCETTPPPGGQDQTAQTLVPTVQTFPMAGDDVVSSTLGTVNKNAMTGPFSPLGDWVGSYTCAQGYTGGTLKIDHASGRSFSGVFEFYPTSKNRTVPPGSYEVSGQYDTGSKRFVLNPGKWIKHPRHFYNTEMVGRFDPINDALSLTFEGVDGCTSFEAHRQGPVIAAPARARHEHRHVKRKKTHKRKTHKEAPAPAPVSDAAPAPEQPAAETPAPVAASPAAAPPPAASETAPAETPSLPPEDKGVPAPGINVTGPATK